MRSMYEQGASLERVGDRFGDTSATVRKHLLCVGVVMRDTEELSPRRLDDARTGQ